MRLIKAKYILVVNGLFLFGLLWWTVSKIPQTSESVQRTSINPPFYPMGSGDLSRLAHVYFPKNKVFHVNGVAYDFYSIWELGKSEPGQQWLTFPLPGEINNKNIPPPWHPICSSVNLPIHISPLTKTRIAFLEQVYVISDEGFVDRHEHLKKVFHRQAIPDSSIHWVWKWNRTTCNAKNNFDEVYRKKLNMKPGKLKYYFLIIRQRYT
ncbi:hypothetical protein I4U23_012353 [Adineta vaga]|nr:hypothetical protein I4U23_012353 [Adineta vaga]